MKKYMLIILLIFSVSMYADLTDAEITVSSGNVNAGDSILITVSTSEILEEWDVISFQFEMYFDPEVVSYSSFIEGDTFDDDGMIFVNELEPGVLRTAYSYYEAQTGFGNLVGLYFIGISGSTELDIHDFKFNAVLIENTTNGSITVDGSEESEDVSELINKVTIQSISPNPFNPRTTISFTVPANESEIEIGIYSVKGQLVKKYHLTGLIPNSVSQVIWQGKDNQGNEVASGVYFCKIKAANSSAESRLLLLK